MAVLCIVYGGTVGEIERRRAAKLLGLVGEVIELDEELIDAATAIMGCSPGYLALMAEVLVEAGVKEGLTTDQAKRMVARSMSATGGLLELREPAELKQAVASPGGMTEAGLKALEQRHFREVLLAAVDASLERARQ
jgi:pyrroline-5-carboxylate reductase